MNDILAAYKKTAVELLNDPDSAEALTNQFVLLHARGERSAAQLALARRAAALAPDVFLTKINLGSAELRAGRYLAAVQHFTEALALADKPNEIVALQHIGLAWYAHGDLDEAMKYYRRAEVIAPDSKELQQSIAITRLMAGDLTAMFEFECKFHSPRRKAIAETGIHRWMGEDLTGKTIIVAHEQGFGDTIQFSRFIPQLKAEKVIWSGPKSLEILMRENFKFDAMVDEDGPFVADYYCSPISACGALKAEYSAVDPKPYMTAQPIKLPERGKIKIGLAWAGNIDYAHDADRSIALEELMPFLEIPGTAFYSLQVGRGEDEISRLGLDGMIANLGGTFKDWRDTARAIAALDLIITVDSGAAHLAGALGKPVFVLLPYANCWRWMRDRNDTPWYASAKLFRQLKAREWDYPVRMVKAEIENRLGAM